MLVTIKNNGGMYTVVVMNMEGPEILLSLYMICTCSLEILKIREEKIIVPITIWVSNHVSHPLGTLATPVVNE